MDPTGGERQQLWSFREHGGWWYDNVLWSPDGSEILYGSSELGIPETSIVVVGVDGSGPREVPGWQFLGGGGSWSPDGSRIAFHNLGSNSPNVVLLTMARDGPDERVLVRGNYKRLAAEHSGVADDIAACSGGYVIAKPQKNSGLVQDCETLLRIRDALAGDAILNWSADAPISNWEGLSIEGSPLRVTGLDLHNLKPTRLTGVIPPELGHLANLEVLDLQGNRLSGGIPPELGSLTALRHLDLAGNHLTGSIPPEIGNLSGLDSLDLSDNGLSGVIPPELGNLTGLTELRIEGNFVRRCDPMILVLTGERCIAE